MTHAQHHYIPKFLLEQWHTPPDDKLSTFRWAHGRVAHRRWRAKSVAKAEHLYSMWRSREQPDVAVERDFLGPQVDEPASLVHKKLLAGGAKALNDNDMRVWSPFLVSLMLRVPSTIQRIRERGRELLSAELDAVPDGLLAHFPDIRDDLGILTLPRLVHSAELNKALLRAKWGTREIRRSRVDLLIGDRPLVGGEGGLGGSYLIGLPLAPRLAFLAFTEDESWEAVGRQSDEELCRAMNRSSVLAADTFVYASGVGQQSLVRKALRKPTSQT